MTIAISDIRLLGGDPILDFINTIDSRIGRVGSDYLETYADLAEWAHRVVVIGQPELTRLRAMADLDQAAATDALRRARQLREALHTIFQAEGTGDMPDADALATFDSWIERASPHRRFRFNDHHFAWSWSDDLSLDTVAHRLTFSAISLLASREDRRPVRECPGANCGWLFLDTSRSGRRHWCSDATCGSNARVLKYRRKDK